MDGDRLSDYENKIIAAIYDSALESSKWRAVLADICQYVDADEASLLFYDAQHPQRNFVVTAFNLNNDGFVREHLKDEAEKVKLLFNGVSPGKVFTSTDIASRIGISYEEYVGEATKIAERKQLEVRVGIPLLSGEIINAAMGVHCFHGSSALTQHAINFIEILSPHLVRALQIHNHFSILKAEKNTLLEAIKHANLAVLMLNAQSRIVFTSPAADKILASHPALKITKKRQLKAFIHKEQLRLEHILAEFLQNGFEAKHLASDGISLPLQHPDKQHPLKLCFIPLKMTYKADDDPCLAIFLTDPERQRFISPAYLQQAYSLTTTEAQLAQLLLKGLNVADISEQRRTSHETTRWQLKQIMHKTQTHSQVELIRLLSLLSNEFNYSVLQSIVMDTSIA